MADKKELEKELKIYKDRLEDAMAAGNLAWWEMELPSGEIDFNDRKAEMLGYPPEKFTHYSDFTDLLHSEDYDRAMKAMRDHLEGKAERYEVEYRIEKKDGDYKWFRDVGGITEEDKESEYKKVTGIVIDIDERKKAEEREEFLHSLLRHDVRNKSQIVQGYLELMEDFDLSAKVREYLEKSKRGIRESMDIIEKVRMLRKAEEEETEEVKIESVVENVVEENRSKAREEDMEIEMDCPDFDCKVQGGSLLKEVFTNLLGNSIRHSGGSKIRISARETGNEIVCTIEDDGEGIPDSDKDKVFAEGYTTDEDRGTGIGLFLVKKLLDIYGGSIEVKDSELSGARFDIHLRKSE